MTFRIADATSAADTGRHVAIASKLRRVTLLPASGRLRWAVADGTALLPFPDGPNHMACHHWRVEESDHLA